MKNVGKKLPKGIQADLFFFSYSATKSNRKFSEVK